MLGFDLRLCIALILCASLMIGLGKGQEREHQWNLALRTTAEYADRVRCQSGDHDSGD